jgi:hypothetical protein
MSRFDNTRLAVVRIAFVLSVEGCKGRICG